MRLLALLLLAGRLGAACASGSLAYWTLDNVITDPCNGYTLTTVGAPTFTTSNPCEGAYSATSFSGANYFAIPAGLVTAIGTPTAFTWEGYVYLTSANKIHEIFRAAFSSGAAGMQIVTSNDAAPVTIAGQVFNGGWAGVTATDALALNTCYYIAMTYSNASTGTVKLYIDNVEIGTQTNVGVVGPITLLYLGSDTSSFLSGTLDAVRLSNVVRTSFPTVDGSATAQPLSPYVNGKQSHSPSVTPLWWMP